MPLAINLRESDDPRDAIHRAVQALAEGKLVALPTETVYGVAVSALSESAFDRLQQLKSRSAGHPFTLAVKSAEAAWDYVPNMDPLGLRLTRRCWPGPVTFVLPADHPDSLLKQLPRAIRQRLAPQGTLGLRVPAHSFVLSVLRLSAGPLVLTSANLAGQEAAVTGEEIGESLGDAVDLILDDGRAKFARASSVVALQNGKLEVLREGVVTQQNLRRLSRPMVLVVCTGNTCRSPMAEVLLKHHLNQRTGSADDDSGAMVLSAGIAAMPGGRATQEAIDAVAGRGLDLTGHESQPLTDRLVRFADLILTMTQNHRAAIVSNWPDAAARTFVLSPDGDDVHDPIGQPAAQYRRCAEQIDQFVQAWLDRIDVEPTTIVNSNPAANGSAENESTGTAVEGE